MDNNKRIRQFLKSKNIKSEPFREYLHLQSYLTCNKFFLFDRSFLLLT